MKLKIDRNSIKKRTCAQDAPRGPQDAPRTLQDAPETAQDACKTRPRRPKTPPRRPKTPPRRSQRRPKMRPRRSKDTLRGSQRPPNLGFLLDFKLEPCWGWILEVFGVFLCRVLDGFSTVFEVDSRRKSQGNSHASKPQDTSNKTPRYLQTWASEGSFYVIFTLFLCYSYVNLTLA